MRSRKKRLAQGHHSNCQYNLCFANAKATSISTKQSDRFLIGSLACTHLAWSWEWEEYQKWHSWWLFYNPNLTPSPRSFPAIQHLQEQHTHTHTSVSISTGLMPKKGRIAIPGTISASGSDGLGAMQMPPVSENRAERVKCEYISTFFLQITLPCPSHSAPCQLVSVYKNL